MDEEEWEKHVQRRLQEALARQPLAFPLPRNSLDQVGSLFVLKDEFAHVMKLPWRGLIITSVDDEGVELTCVEFQRIVKDEDDYHTHTIDLDSGKYGPMDTPIRGAGSPYAQPHSHDYGMILVMRWLTINTSRDKMEQLLWFASGEAARMSPEQLEHVEEPDLSEQVLEHRRLEREAWQPVFELFV